MKILTEQELRMAKHPPVHKVRTKSIKGMANKACYIINKNKFTAKL